MTLATIESAIQVSFRETNGGAGLGWMKLSTRLVLLVLGCLLPILTVQVYSQINLYAERHEQLGGLVLRQADWPMPTCPASSMPPVRLARWRGSFRRSTPTAPPATSG